MRIILHLLLEICQILNDISIELKKYAKQIKKKQKFYFIITLNFTFVRLIYLLFKILKTLKLVKKSPINKNTLNYIKLNPLINEKYGELKISFNQTIDDTVNFFNTN